MASRDARGHWVGRGGLPWSVAAGFLLVAFAVLMRPAVQPGIVPAQPPDGLDYVYGAAGLLHGRYLVEWDGLPRIPRYPPGMSVLLLPVVAAGGVEATGWLPYAAVLVVAGVAVLLAAKLGGARAAALAVAVLLGTRLALVFTTTVLSDLPAAALGMCVAALLALRRRPAAALLAGLIAGGDVWVRYSSLVLLPAGLAALSTLHSWPARCRVAAWFVVGAALPLLCLALWQWAAFGSPLLTSYDAYFRIHPELLPGPTFSLRYILERPPMMDLPHDGGLPWRWPNAAAYPLQLAGLDSFLLVPGMGIAGALWLLRTVRRTDAAGAFARFGTAAIAATLALYLPYFYQSARFLTLPAALLGTASAVGAAEILARRLGASGRAGARVGGAPGRPASRVSPPTRSGG